MPDGVRRIIVQRLHGLLTIEVDPEAADNTVVLIESGPFEEIFEVDYLFLRPIEHKPVSIPGVSGAARGSIKIIVGPEVMSIKIQDCYGDRRGPDADLHLMRGDDIFSLATTGH